MEFRAQRKVPRRSRPSATSEPEVGATAETTKRSGVTIERFAYEENTGVQGGGGFGDGACSRGPGGRRAAGEARPR